MKYTCLQAAYMYHPYIEIVKKDAVILFTKVLFLYIVQWFVEMVRSRHSTFLSEWITYTGASNMFLVPPRIFRDDRLKLHQYYFSLQPCPLLNAQPSHNLTNTLVGFPRYLPLKWSESFVVIVTLGIRISQRCALTWLE